MSGAIIEKPDLCCYPEENAVTHLNMFTWKKLTKLINKPAVTVKGKVERFYIDFSTERVVTFC